MSMSVTVGEMVQKIQRDPHLREALGKATDPESRIAAFQEAGLTVTAADLANAKASLQKGELSDKDLERVAGGMGQTTTWALQSLVVTLTAFG
jgi:predicted ribosomally synthesized peptide with nif11-like leader